MGIFGFLRSRKASAPTYALKPIEGAPYASPDAKVFIEGERALLTEIYRRIVTRVWATWRRFDALTLPPIQSPAFVCDAELSAFAILRQAILTDQGVGGVIAADQLPNVGDAELADWLVRMLAEAKKRENRMARWVPSFRSLVLRMGEWGTAKSFHQFAEVWTLDGKRTMAGLCEPAAPVRGTGQFFRGFPKRKGGPLGRTYATPPAETTKRKPAAKTTARSKK